MHQEKYSIKWETYSVHLKTMMKELMMNEEFSDVTLVTEDKKELKANINILSACSPVFKDILKKEKNSNQIMYLRGIQFSELESIMQFIYLGEATFYEERIDEFLAVAKSLEIRELSNAEPKIKNEPDDEPTLSDPVTSTEEMGKEMLLSDHLAKQAPQKRSKVISVNSKYECKPCQKTFTTRAGLYFHNQSVHQGVKYACDQCDYQATRQSHLTVHIESKHEGVRYACFLCYYQARDKSYLNKHIQSKHEGVKYPCNQCDYKATTQQNLTLHIKNKHEGVKYVTTKLDYQAT